ncbi:MAG: lipid A biosynthesis acyltransferase [Casimicrobiaceae bacterium]|nr:lipid A biosynthesis acyltransferase [Casimicrobiaceae bacterium]MCX8098646.1 lipid A biosynthesis acyltransferase [Casimicrobiaceae bacterium]MDW8311917.1 lipid A biosynthesis acyltransferase [Burkholderiales bacterium]
MSLAGVALDLGVRLLASLPPTWMRPLSQALVVLAAPLARARRRIALTNLRLCFPNLTEAERKRLVREHLRAYLQAALEHGLLWRGSAEAIRRYVRLHDEHHWRRFYEGPASQRRPVIWLCPHFVGLDAAAIRISVDTSGCSLYSTQSNAEFDRRLLAGRTRFGHSKIIARTEGVRPIIRAMREGLPLYYLPDMDFGARDSVFVPFFNVPAATITGVSRIAKLTGAAVVPVVATQRADGTGYDVRFHPAWEDFPSGDDAADARRVNAFIESQITGDNGVRLAQYLWTHRRFKTRPPGMKGVY